MNYLKRRLFLKSLIALGTMIFTGFRAESKLRALECKDFDTYEWKIVRMQNLKRNDVFRYKDDRQHCYLVTGEPYQNDNKIWTVQAVEISGEWRNHLLE